MNDEIKEILDNFEKYEARYKLHNETQFIITHREIEPLLDYITNLQEEIKQYESPNDMTLFYMWLDEKAKDKIKYLQQENKKMIDWIQKILQEFGTYEVRERKSVQIPIMKHKDFMYGDNNMRMTSETIIIPEIIIHKGEF